MEELKFEWDDNKNKMNQKKHGISFEKALGVFYDPDRIDLIDIKHSTPQEERYITIGMFETVLFVVYTERTDIIRLISARKANKEECNDYFSNCNKR